MPVNAPFKESETDTATQPSGHHEGQREMVGEPIEIPGDRLPSDVCSCPSKQGTRLLVAGAWILVAIQFLAIAGDLINRHARDPSIDAFLSVPSSRNIADALGFLVGATLPGIAALLGGLSLCKRRNHPSGRSLTVTAVLAVILAAGSQLMPTSSLVGGRDLSTPSSRLTGHWIEANGAEAYYASLHPSVGVGTFTAGTLSGRYKIVSEDRSGTRLVLMEFVKLEEGTASAIANIDISPDGSSMSQECVIGDSRFLLIYRYADGGTQP